MTKRLPERSVEAKATRQGRPRLTAIERRALATVEDENLRRTLGELLIASRGSQKNFEELETWFPIQPEDINAVSGVPFREVVWCEAEGAKGKISRGGDGLSFQRLATGVYRILVEEGFEFSLPADFVNALPRVAVGAQAVAVDVEPTKVEGVGEGWLIHLFQNVAESTPVDSTFYFLAGNFVDAEGNTIVGPKGPPGPTHKSLWHGAGPPEESLGEVDDFYVDIENFIFYGPKTEEGWGEGDSLVGPQGEPGEPGEPGAAGKEGKEGKEGKVGTPAGFKYTYSNNTENNDPGAGKLKFDKAIGSAPTSMRISETDADGNSLASFLATFDDSTNAAKGIVVLRKFESNTVFAIFQINGALVDNGTWDSIPVAHVTSNPPANGDTVYMTFYRIGDQGEKGANGAAGAAGATGPAGAPIVKCGGNPGSETGTFQVSAIEIQGNSNGFIGVEGLLDGVELKLGDWFFHFTGSKMDGIWEVKSTGGPGSKWRAERPSGADTAQRVERTTFTVGGGATADRLRRTFRCLTTGITLGTTVLTFRRLVNWGVGEYETDGSTKTTTVTITHGLGVVPSSIQLTRRAGEGTTVMVQPYVVLESETETQFKVKGISPAALAAGQKLTFYWEAR